MINVTIGGTSPLDSTGNDFVDEKSAVIGGPTLPPIESPTAVPVLDPAVVPTDSPIVTVPTLNPASVPVLGSICGNVKEDIDNDNIEVFPNPADSIINITNSKSDIKSIELSDMGGRVLEVKKVNKKDIQFDISNYENGTYLIKIITKDGNTIKKFIKY